MTKDQLYPHVKVWCWWHSRWLWYTGRMTTGGYEFKDICDVVVTIPENSLKDLRVRKYAG